MKKLLVSFLIAIIFVTPFFAKINFAKICYAKQIININVDNLNFEIDFDSYENINISKTRKSLIDLSYSEKIEIIKKMQGMGFDKKTIINYISPDIAEKINKIAEKVYVEPQNAGVKSVKNCKIEYKNAKNGVKIDKNLIYDAIFDYLVNNRDIHLNTQQTVPELNIDDIKGKFVKCGSYKTNFNSKFESRKHNIECAINAIDGKFIKSGETFSFNQTTGIRNEENGYQSAKIIENGKYVEGFGGGVCQVSSTLYNAALLSGLSVIESCGHSLKSSYVRPGFDAMVNYGSADLKIKNNTANDYIITASAEGGICQICIYGVKPEYNIKLRSEIVDDICESQINSLHVKTYADYYLGETLVKTVKLRETRYKQPEAE